MRTTGAEPSFDFAISYAGPDRSVALQLARLLTNQGLSVFIDTLHRARLLGRRLDYPRLCDWLAGELLARLSRSAIVNPQLIEDSRDGDTFSVRVAFEWTPQAGPLELPRPNWWDVLEVLPYQAVYERMP